MNGHAEGVCKDRPRGLAARVVVAGMVALGLAACDVPGGPTGNATTIATAPSAQSSAPDAATSPGRDPRPDATTTATDDATPAVQLSGLGDVDVVTLPLDRWDVRVDWPQDPAGTDLGAYLDAHPDVVVLTNAGIFSTDLSPGGLLVSDGEELSALNLADGAGNFHMKPNAVFAVRRNGTATVVESSQYRPRGVMQATQSGPALVLDGQIHPAFVEGSEHVAIRSGVGVSNDGRTVYLAMSNGFITLWDFASVFRDDLGVDNALYLDGQISQLWVAGVSDDPWPFLGPYSGVIAVTPR